MRSLIVRYQHKKLRVYEDINGRPTNIAEVVVTFDTKDGSYKSIHFNEFDAQIEVGHLNALDVGACRYCYGNDHTGDEHFDKFIQSDCPDDIKAAVKQLIMAYGIRGQSDPGYFANVIAKNLGRGDGESNFSQPV